MVRIEQSARIESFGFFRVESGNFSTSTLNVRIRPRCNAFYYQFQALRAVRRKQRGSNNEDFSRRKAAALCSLARITNNRIKRLFNTIKDAE